MAKIVCEKCKQTIECNYSFNLVPTKALLAMVTLRVLCPKCKEDIEVTFIPLRDDIKEKIDYIPLVKQKSKQNVKRKSKERKPNYIA